MKGAVESMRYIKAVVSSMVCSCLMFVGWGDTITIHTSGNSSHLSGNIGGIPLNAHSDFSGNTIRTYGSVDGTSFSETTRFSDNWRTVQETGNFGGSHYSISSRDFGDSVRTTGVIDGETFSDMTRIGNDTLYSNGRIGNESYNYTVREAGRDAVTISGNFGGEHFNETVRFSDYNMPSVNFNMSDLKLPDFNMSDISSSDFDFSGF